MAWLKLEDTFSEHPKIDALADALGIKLLLAQAHVINLWCWALRFAPDGDLRTFSAPTIERRARWEGEQGQLIEAMTEVGLLDTKDDGSLSIHGWMRRAKGYKEALRAAARRDKSATSTQRITEKSTTHHRERETERKDREEREEKRERRETERESSAQSELVTNHERFSASKVAELWNTLCSPPLPPVLKVNDKRRAKVKTITAELAKGESPVAWWRRYFERVSTARFLLGENDRAWKASFDWATHSSSNVIKVLEGNYDRPGFKRHAVDHAVDQLLEDLDNDEKAPAIDERQQPKALGAGGGDSRLDGRTGGRGHE